MRKKRAVLFCIVAGCLMMGGCGTLRSEKAFDTVSAGMSRRDVVKRIGSPAMERGSLINDRGERVQVWEYKVGSPKKFEQVLSELCMTAVSCGGAVPVLLSSAETDRYWIYMVNGTFAGWGRAGYWELDADTIRSMRFDRQIRM